MTVKVKICGLRRPEDVDFANRLRPDVVGFVFAAGSARSSARTSVPSAMRSETTRRKASFPTFLLSFTE